MGRMAASRSSARRAGHGEGCARACKAVPRGPGPANPTATRARTRQPLLQLVLLLDLDLQLLALLLQLGGVLLGLRAREQRDSSVKRVALCVGSPPLRTSPAAPTCQPTNQPTLRSSAIFLFSALKSMFSVSMSPRAARDGGGQAAVGPTVAARARPLPRSRALASSPPSLSHTPHLASTARPAPAPCPPARHRRSAAAGSRAAAPHRRPSLRGCRRDRRGAG